MPKSSKIVIDHNQITSDLTLEEIVALISTGNRTSPEYGITIMILRTMLRNTPPSITQEEMYDLYMRNREFVSKASFYRILNKLISRGMILQEQETDTYQPSILFSNALQKLAYAWEKIALNSKQ
jgi:hypothetical protein